MHLVTVGSSGRIWVSENIALPLSSSSIFTVPDSKLLPALAVVSLNADHVPRPPTTPTSPSTTAVMSNFIPTRLFFRSSVGRATSGATWLDIGVSLFRYPTTQAHAWVTWRPSYLRETSGFASPPRGGFALFTSLCRMNIGSRRETLRDLLEQICPRPRRPPAGSSAAAAGARRRTPPRRRGGGPGADRSRESPPPRSGPASRPPHRAAPPRTSPTRPRTARRGR